MYYHAMNYETINSMAMIYILPALAKSLVILHISRGIFESYMEEHALGKGISVFAWSESCILFVCSCKIVYI